jgi:hypothetical protein
MREGRREKRMSEVELYTGIFGWNRAERITDRYGSVKLFNKESKNGHL